MKQSILRWKLGSFFVGGPYSVVGIQIEIREVPPGVFRSYDLGGVHGSTDEEDLFLTREVAKAEAYLRNEKEKEKEDG